MSTQQRPAGPRGVVVTYAPGDGDRASEHERITHLAFARQLAALRGEASAGAYRPAAHPPGRAYFLPGCTLTCAQAQALGIRGADDLFGGVVPHAFVATKAISHPLLAPGATAPCGWNPEFAQRLGEAVLAGWTAFSREDARRAGTRLLAAAPVRVKPARATGGRGQAVARDVAQLDRLLASLDEGEIAAHGLVLEEDLDQVRTYSVGQVHVADLTASYFGVQRLTRDNRGHEVFGGTDLVVVRGGFDALLAVPGCNREVALALGHAQRYDAAASACFPGFFASRRNYDVVAGRDAAGRPRVGVLEQSWRAGGATGAELAALEAFRADPARRCARAACFEVFGEGQQPPPGATVHFAGIDPEVGPLAKYTLLEPDDHPH